MQSGTVSPMPRTKRDESQTFRALLRMRELLLRGEFRPGERIPEIPLSARLHVSRTPLRLVLHRLEEEGLVKARPTGGYVASEFSIRDIYDGIEIRGVLEGSAAKLAAERLRGADELTEIRHCLDRIDRLIQTWTSGTDSLAKYIALNARCVDAKDDFSVPEVEEKEKPSPEQIEANKGKWGYAG